MSELKKAYDYMVLLERLKDKGLVLGEEAAKMVYVELKEWIVESAMASENPYDDLGVPFIKQLDAVVLPQLDKISPE